MLEAWLEARSCIWWILWRRNIKNGKFPLAAKHQQVVRVNLSQEVFELFGGGPAAGRRKIQRR